MVDRVWRVDGLCWGRWAFFNWAWWHRHCGDEDGGRGRDGRWLGGGGGHDDVGGGTAQDGHGVAVRANVWACGDAVVWLQAMRATVRVGARCAMADVSLEELAKVCAVGVDLFWKIGTRSVLETVIFGNCGIGGICERVPTGTLGVWRGCALRGAWHGAGCARSGAEAGLGNDVGYAQGKGSGRSGECGSKQRGMEVVLTPSGRGLLGRWW